MANSYPPPDARFPYGVLGWLRPRQDDGAPAFPLVGSGETIATVRKALHDSDAVMVIDDGKPVGVLTRADLLAFLADGRSV